MDGTALAEERRAIALHEGAGLRQDAPEALGVERVIGGVHLIYVTANGVAHFAGQGVDGDLDAQRVQAVHKFAVKRGHRARDERQRPGRPLAGTHEEVVFNEVERHLKGAPR